MAQVPAIGRAYTEGDNPEPLRRIVVVSEVSGEVIGSYTLPLPGGASAINPWYRLGNDHVEIPLDAEPPKVGTKFRR